MEIFKQLNKIGYKHYVDLTIEELDKLPIDSIERRIECSLIIDWFREKYKINCIVGYTDDDKEEFMAVIDRPNQDIDYNMNPTESYYEAREQAILKCIELLKSK